MTATWEEFTWIPDEYPWTPGGVSFTFVRHDDAETVLDAMTTSTTGTVTGLEGVNADVEVVGVVQVGDWVLAVAPSVAGLSDEVMAPLSVGGEVLTFATQVGHSNFAQWVDGARTAMFDAALKDGPGFDAPDSPWRDRMREVGADPDSEGPMSDGRYHTLEIHLAMIVSHTGVELARELLRSGQFQVGDSLE
ncbi:hypothetical protein CH293_27095 [Rhodococcus sp. 14-2470-1b]|uniref:DUF6461 domain-containing protein n=1 Tax=Rhodococcus sp. 14-2470-1b TaxID=2023149 RepID=UPI000B9AE614|nr:DUF6461 domain-containing protein [Rhodococcus sp. 14-2470-1b]OZF41950.1 hypothetical protein CH293_27095 [Rhodococcus sp. 14-2470-1b]